MNAFLDEQRLSCKPSTIGTYTVGLNAFIKSASIPTARHMNGISTAVLRRHLRYLTQRQLAPYTKVNYLLTVKKYLMWEVGKGTIAKSIIKNFDRSFLPKVPEYLPRPLSSDTDRLLINRLQHSDHPYASFFLLLRLTGLRISELINLSKSCVVTNARNEHYLKVPLGKMDNERLVPLSHEAFSLISKISATLPIDKRESDPDRLIGIKGTVKSVYGHLNIQFEKILGGMVDQNKAITFHRLRHTYATTLLAGGVSIVSIMKLLGHRRIEMSLRYAKVTPSHIRNEYLKALAVLEQQWAPHHEHNSTPTTLDIYPPELINRLAAFLKKEASVNPSKQKNFFRKLARLKTTLENMSFNRNFPLHV